MQFTAILRSMRILDIVKLAWNGEQVMAYRSNEPDAEAFEALEFQTGSKTREFLDKMNTLPVTRGFELISPAIPKYNS